MSVNFGKVSENTELILLYGFITVFYKDNDGNIIGKRFCDDEKNYTLQDCYNIAVENGFDVTTHNTIYVMAEDMLHGDIYCYGNHGDFWERVGETVGLA